MPLNSLAPGYIKLHYSVTISSLLLVHTITLPVNVATFAGNSTLVTLKNATLLSWTSAAAAYVNVLKALLASAASAFIGYDLYSQANAESEPVFEATAVDVTAGTGGTGAIAAVMQTITFRTVKGGAAKCTVLEGIFGGLRHQNYSAAGTQVQAISDYLTGNTSPYYARDNSYPALMLFSNGKESDILRRKRLGIG